MADKSKHAFGMLENVDNAISNGLIDEFDILFVKDAYGNPYIGWVDKEGQKVILQDKIQIVRVDELPTADGDENVVYIHNNEGYIWDSNNNQCVPMSKSADLIALETQVASLSAQMENKVDAATVQNMVKEQVDSAYEIIEF